MTQGWNNFLNIAKTSGKTAAEYTPYVGDVIDIGEGLYQATHGHPWLGSGQAALGGAGLASNILFPGTGSVGKAAVKGAAKKAATKIPAILENFAKWNRSGKGMVQSTLLPNLGYFASDVFNKPSNKSELHQSDNGVTTNSNSNKSNGNVSYNPQKALAEISITKTTNQEQPSMDMDFVNDYISQLQSIQQPYIDALKSYVDNYNNMLDKRQRAARFWQGAASLTGNPNWAKLGEQYNTLSNEANRIAAIKQLQDAQAGDINAINEVMGNLAIAQEMDLPYEAAFANKNLLTALTANRRQLTDLEKAQIMADIRRYGYDSAFARALQVQGMKGQNALDVANIYMGGGVAPGLNNQGTIQQRNIQN